MRSSLFACVAVLAMACNAQTRNGTTPEPIVTDLQAAAFNDRIAAGDGKLVDVRTPAEFASGHIPGAVNIDWSADNYETEFGKLDKKTPVLLYCAMGGRSDQAKEYLEEKGYTAIQLLDGIGGWKKAGLPVEK